MAGRGNAGRGNAGRGNAGRDRGRDSHELERDPGDLDRELEREF